MQDFIDLSRKLVVKFGNHLVDGGGIDRIAGTGRLEQFSDKCADALARYIVALVSRRHFRFLKDLIKKRAFLFSYDRLSFACGFCFIHWFRPQNQLLFCAFSNRPDTSPAQGRQMTARIAASIFVFGGLRRSGQQFGHQLFTRIFIAEHTLDRLAKSRHIAKRTLESDQRLAKFE